MVTVSDRTVPARPGERSRERDVGGRQRSSSGRNDHGVTSQQRESRQIVVSERGRDSHAAPDRAQPVKTAAPTTTDSRAKSSSASTAGGQLTTSSLPRSSTSSNTSSTAVHSERPPADRASDKTPAKVSNCCMHAVSVE